MSICPNGLPITFLSLLLVMNCIKKYNFSEKCLSPRFPQGQVYHYLPWVEESVLVELYRLAAIES